jgi:hypothetical protein
MITEWERPFLRFSNMCGRLLKKSRSARKRWPPAGELQSKTQEGPIPIMLGTVRQQTSRVLRRTLEPGKKHF